MAGIVYFVLMITCSSYIAQIIANLYETYRLKPRNVQINQTCTSDTVAVYVRHHSKCCFN